MQKQKYKTKCAKLYTLISKDQRCGYFVGTGANNDTHPIINMKYTDVENIANILLFLNCR